MAISRVLSRGQVTLPSDVRRKAEIKPGDVVNIEVIGKGEVRFRVLPKLSPRELRELYPIDVEIDEARDRLEWEKAAAEDALGSNRG
jgi:AbrB family looped-hinge helix DNA binding protein